jgi:hypothetical protein
MPIDLLAWFRVACVVLIILSVSLTMVPVTVMGGVFFRYRRPLYLVVLLLALAVVASYSVR